MNFTKPSVLDQNEKFLIETMPVELTSPSPPFFTLNFISIVFLPPGCLTAVTGYETPASVQKDFILFIRNRTSFRALEVSPAVPVYISVPDTVAREVSY